MLIYKRGQSLIEILIAVTVAGVLVGGSAVLVTVVLQSTTQNRYFQAAGLLGQELMDRVTVFAEAKWYCSPTNCPNADGTPTGIYNLFKDHSQDPTHKYWLDQLVSSFISKPGSEARPLNATDLYTRYFYVENVSRDGNGDIQSTYDPAREDPSTQKITVWVEWTNNGPTKNITLVKYLTRSRNQAFRQTDWSGGSVPPANCGQAINSPDNTFCDSTGIDFSTAPGVIQLSP